MELELVTRPGGGWWCQVRGAWMGGSRGQATVREMCREWPPAPCRVTVGVVFVARLSSFFLGFKFGFYLSVCCSIFLSGVWFLFKYFLYIYSRSLAHTHTRTRALNTKINFNLARRLRVRPLRFVVFFRLVLSAVLCFCFCPVVSSLSLCPAPSSLVYFGFTSTRNAGGVTGGVG